MSDLKIAPHSLEAEQSVLGSILILQKADRAIGEIFDLLDADMFYSRSHQVIYKSMLSIGAMNELDLITVSEHMEEAGTIDEAGGFTYLGDIAHRTPSASNVFAYCDIIKDRYVKRRIIGDLHAALDGVYSGESTTDVMAMIERNMGNIDLGGAYEPTHINTKIDDWLGTMERRISREEGAIGIQTGLNTLDDQIVGVQPNWLVVLAGRPSMGKTLMAQLINAHVSKTAPSLFFTMEMSSDEVMERYIGVMAGVNAKSMKQGSLSEYEYSRVNPILAGMRDNKYKIYYDETPALALNQIRHRVKSSIKKIGPLGLVTIDYLGINGERQNGAG